MTRDEVTDLAREMPDEALLNEYLEARRTLEAPGYRDFPNEAVEQAAEVAREEILRRMRPSPLEFRHSAAEMDQLEEALNEEPRVLPELRKLMSEPAPWDRGNV